MRSDGAIYIDNKVPRTLNDYSFRVVVRDQFMASNGNTAGQVAIDVFVNVDSTYI